MTRRDTFRMAIALIAFVCYAPRARAIEMFTNFNNGMEFNTRPIGIDQLPPVRYHRWQPAPGQGLFGRRLRGCDWDAGDENAESLPESVPAPAGHPTTGQPIQVRTVPAGNVQPDEDDSPSEQPSREESRRPQHDWRSHDSRGSSDGRGGNDWRRGESYLPQGE